MKFKSKIWERMCYPSSSLPKGEYSRSSITRPIIVVSLQTSGALILILSNKRRPGQTLNHRASAAFSCSHCLLYLSFYKTNASHYIYLRADVMYTRIYRRWIARQLISCFLEKPLTCLNSTDGWNVHMYCKIVWCRNTYFHLGRFGKISANRQRPSQVTDNKSHLYIPILTYLKYETFPIISSYKLHMWCLHLTCDTEIPHVQREVHLFNAKIRLSNT
jgi:hypothetical protein